MKLAMTSYGIAVIAWLNGSRRTCGDRRLPPPLSVRPRSPTVTRGWPSMYTSLSMSPG